MGRDLLIIFAISMQNVSVFFVEHQWPRYWCLSIHLIYTHFLCNEDWPHFPLLYLILTTSLWSRFWLGVCDWLKVTHRVSIAESGFEPRTPLNQVQHSKHVGCGDIKKSGNPQTHGNEKYRSVCTAQTDLYRKTDLSVQHKAHSALRRKHFSSGILIFPHNLQAL